MFPLDVFDVFENLNLFGTCRHISHQHIHECMSRLHDDTMFRSCIHCTLKHIPIRTSSCHILYKNISRFKKQQHFLANVYEHYRCIWFYYISFRNNLFCLLFTSNFSFSKSNNSQWYSLPYIVYFIFLHMKTISLLSLENTIDSS